MSSEAMESLPAHPARTARRGDPEAVGPAQELGDDLVAAAELGMGVGELKEEQIEQCGDVRRRHVRPYLPVLQSAVGVDIVRKGQRPFDIDPLATEARRYPDETGEPVDSEIQARHSLVVNTLVPMARSSSSPRRYSPEIASAATTILKSRSLASQIVARGQLGKLHPQMTRVSIPERRVPETLPKEVPGSTAIRPYPAGVSRS